MKRKIFLTTDTDRTNIGNIRKLFQYATSINDSDIGDICNIEIADTSASLTEIESDDSKMYSVVCTDDDEDTEYEDTEYKDIINYNGVPISFSYNTLVNICNELTSTSSDINQIIAGTTSTKEGSE